MNKVAEWVEWNNDTKQYEKAFCGSDSVLWIDGRLNNYRAMLEAQRVKESFKKNFKHKYDKMNRIRFKGSIIIVDLKLS